MERAGQEKIVPVGPTIIMIADGWTRRIFWPLLHSGQLPDIADSLLAEGGSTDVVSNLPTVSLASHTTLLTSRNQTEHGVIGHRWLDAETQHIHNYLGPLGARHVNADISPDVSTIFERYRSAISVQSVVRRGATKHSWIPSMHSGPLLAATADRAIRHPESVIVTWLPRGDAVAHSYGPDSRQVADDMRETSVAIGRLVSRLSQADLLDDARLLLVPDHGHRSVSQNVDLGAVLASAGITSTINARPKRPGVALTLTSGDSSALVYLQPNNVSRALDFGRNLAEDESIELVCAPTGAAIHFFGRTGESVAEYREDPTTARYHVVAGTDPLNLGPNHSSQEFDLSEPMVDGIYPDILHQISKSFVRGRSGDLLLLASAGRHFGQAPRLAWRMGYHRGSHGGPFADEILVSAIYRGVTTETSTGPIRSADLLERLGLLSVSGVVDAYPR